MYLIVKMLDEKMIETQVNNILADYDKWKSGVDFHNCSQPDFEVIMEARYEYLYKNASTLFKKACNNEINKEWLDKMLNMMRSIKYGNITYFNGSKEIGQVLTDHYVKPLVEKKK